MEGATGGEITGTESPEVGEYTHCCLFLSTSCAPAEKSAVIIRRGAAKCWWTYLRTYDHMCANTCT
jgi:hypothetical protein